jgi:hypothetical protein
VQGRSGRDECSKREPDGRDRLEAPVCVHVYVWIFMVTLSVSPVLCLLGACDVFGRREAHLSLLLVGLMQATLYVAQRRCSTEDLSYWEGLLGAAASVTTGRNLISLLRTFPLLCAIVILSVGFALDHDQSSGAHHAGLRFGRLIIWAHKQRLRK